jgi:hypothetical protein
MTGPTNHSKITLQSDARGLGWKTVSGFVLNTFDDLHAERDYVVKVAFRTASALPPRTDAPPPWPRCRKRT